MKRNLKHIVAANLILLLTAFFNFAQADQAPPVPPGGGGGVVGPGSAATPIDMYQIALFVFALFLVAYFYKKIKLSKI